LIFGVDLLSVDTARRTAASTIRRFHLPYRGGRRHDFLKKG